MKISKKHNLLLLQICSIAFLQQLNASYTTSDGIDEYTEQDFNNAMKYAGDNVYHNMFTFVHDPYLFQDPTDETISKYNVDKFNPLYHKIALDSLMKSPIETMIDAAHIDENNATRLKAQALDPAAWTNETKMKKIAEQIDNYLNQRAKIYQENFQEPTSGYIMSHLNGERSKSFKNALEIANKQMAEKNWFENAPEVSAQDKQGVIAMLRSMKTPESKDLLNIILNPYVAIPVATAALGYAAYTYFYPAQEEQVIEDSTENQDPTMAEANA